MATLPVRYELPETVRAVVEALETVRLEVPVVKVKLEEVAKVWRELVWY